MDIQASTDREPLSRTLSSKKPGIPPLLAHFPAGPNIPRYRVSRIRALLLDISTSNTINPARGSAGYLGNMGSGVSIWLKPQRG